LFDLFLEFTLFSHFFPKESPRYKNSLPKKEKEKEKEVTLVSGEHGGGGGGG